MTDQHTDVLIIGAGLSAIDAAYRIRERNPELTLTIAESRDRLGGTWELFRYPGVRSDSDIYTLAFPFKPWRGARSIVDGDELLDYVHETVRETGLGQHIRYGLHIVSADWSPVTARWRVTARTAAGTEELTARFIVFGTGYYDYEQPHDPGFAGLDDFAGRLVHPQFWPADLDYAGRRVVVIGSGATAVTVVPTMAKDAAHVTMLQRTPTYVIAQPRTDALADVLRRVLPAGLAHRLIRSKNTAVQWLLVTACAKFPDRMRALFRKGVIAGVGSAEIADEHFAPPYAPWDQRLCIAPDGDLFAAVRSGAVTMVTGRIDRFVPEGIRLETGEVIEADVVVTATGLKIKLLGGVALSIDGDPVDLASSVTWNGALFSGIPNMAAIIGYINLSWTVRADLSSQLVARVIRRLQDGGFDAVTPVAPDDLGETHPFLDMASGYLSRGAVLMPRATDRYPWAIIQDVYTDSRATRRARLDRGLQWERVRAGVSA